jgi:hypothetical protein
MPFHHDHVDLLVTAAVDYQLLTNPVVSALRGGTGFAMTPNQAGSVLLAARPGPGDPHATGEHLEYIFRRIDRLVPVEVIKACHSFQHAASPTSTWAVSPARRLVEHIHRAATERIPGYADAPWAWRRPRTRPAAPIGLAGTWRPELDVDWLSDSTELAQRWDAAAIVVVTAEVASSAAELPARPHVYVLARTDDLAQSWPAVARCGAEVLVTIPEGLSWLEDRIGDAVHRQELDEPVCLPTAAHATS